MLAAPCGPHRENRANGNAIACRPSGSSTVPGARREGTQEVLELRKVSHLAEGADIPFEIGLHIAAVP